MNNSELLKTSGSRIQNLIRAGSCRIFEFSLKALPIAIVLLASFSLVSAEDYRASQSEVEWVQPFDPTSASMPEHFSSGSTPQAYVEVKQDFSNSPGELVWYKKSASGTSWSSVETEALEPKWDHDQVSADQDYSAETFFPTQDGSLMTLNEGESKTVEINGNEHTFETTSTGIYPSSNPPEVELVVDGTIHDLFEGEYVEVEGVPIRVDEIAEDDVGNERVELDIYDDVLEPGDGNWEYKVTAQTNSNDVYHSNPIYFDISSNNNANRPYVENVTIDGQKLEEFKSYSGISPGSVVSADVIEREGDAYNVTLIDRTGGTTTEIQTQPVNSDGLLEETYSLVLDFTFDPFFDTGNLKGDNSNRVKFQVLPEERDQGTDLFDANGTYDFGFKVEDLGNNVELNSGDGDRNTLSYTLTADGTAYSPNITSVEGSGDCSSYSSLSSFDSRQALNCIRVTATDQDTEELNVVMNLTQVYDNKTYNDYKYVQRGWDTRNGDKYIFNLSKIDSPISEVGESGEWRAEFKASDTITSDTKTVSWNVPWGTLSLDMISPSSSFSMLTNESFDMDLQVSCSGGPECVNQNESLSVYFDPKSSSNLISGVS